VSLDMSVGKPLDADLFLQPKVSWPREMTVGRRHLVEVDLALVTSDGVPAVWPLEEEECVYTCMLDGFGYDLWAVHDACVVVHRFGGSYGPAEFVVTPRPGPADRPLWVTFLNQWGVPVAVRELEVRVLDADGGENTEPGDPEDSAEQVRVDVEVPALAVGGPARAEEPGQDLAGDLAADDQVTLDLDLSYDDPGEPVPDAERPAAELAVPESPGAVAPGSDREDRSPAPYSRPSAPVRNNGERRPDRLAEWYNVAGLRRAPSGSLHWDLVPLFPPGAPSGSEVTFTARCAPSDEYGTVFAVIAEPPSGSAAQERQLRSVQSAKVPPGIYRVTAELLYPFPGHVRFHGLPETPRDETRLWPEISGTVPRRLAAGTGPVHLIAAIEVSGPGGLVAQRIDRVRQLFEHVADEAKDFVCYSVVSYGPHSINVHNPEYPEVPAATLAWAETVDDALRVLARLTRRGAEPIGYPAAAQLECVLTDLERQLTGQEGRPVLVTAGARPAHPPRIDPVSQIIPCRWRNDWRGPMSRMRTRYEGIAFGAIPEADWSDELWRMLSTDTAPGEFSAPGLANSLGLTADSRQLIPLPMFAG
jgi:hypothetical protein